MTLTLVNRTSAYSPARLVEPAPYGYVHLAAAVAPPAGRTPFPPRSPARTALLTRLAATARELETRPDVVKATVYRTAVAPPVPTGGRGPIPHDIVVLVETTEPETIVDVRSSTPYERLAGALSAAALDMEVTEATCAKRIGDVDKTRPGTFLFNYFLTEDVPTALELWDHLAGWYGGPAWTTQPSYGPPATPVSRSSTTPAGTWASPGSPPTSSPRPASAATCSPTCAPTTSPRCPSCTGSCRADRVVTASRGTRSPLR